MSSTRPSGILPRRPEASRIKHHQTNPSSPSVPGKTTLSLLLTKYLNDRHLSSASSNSAPTPVAAFIPMDGYHLTRAQLSSLPDPVTAHARRGAEFTFDGPSFYALIQSLRQQEPISLPQSGSIKTIYAPSFDHAKKDPVENDIPIEPTHRILVFEGNYIALEKKPWSDAAALMDEIWFVEVERGVARKRLAKRHVAAGIAKDEEEGDRRAVENDLPNGDEIIANRLKNVHEVIVSREDGAWV